VLARFYVKAYSEGVAGRNGQSAVSPDSNYMNRRDIVVVVVGFPMMPGVEL
jgi:hypothetical protein